MGFAEKAGSNMRTEIEARSSGGVGWLRTVKDGQDLRVRILRETDDWEKYEEHYVPGGSYFPCTKTASCPGCSSDNDRMRKKSLRYVAPIIVVDEMGDPKDKHEVKALKCSLDLATDFLMKANRNGGSLLDHDWTIIRQGKDQNTKYDIEREELTDYGLPLDQIELVDIEPILAGMFADVWGTAEVPKDSQQHERPVTVADVAPQASKEEKVASLKQGAQKMGGLKPASQVKSGPVSLKPANLPTEDKAPDDPPSEAPAATSDAAGAEAQVTEATLRAMPPEALRTFLAGHSITPEGETTDEIVAWVLENM